MDEIKIIKFEDINYMNEVIDKCVYFISQITYIIYDQNEYYNSQTKKIKEIKNIGDYWIGIYEHFVMYHLSLIIPSNGDVGEKIRDDIKKWLEIKNIAKEAKSISFDKNIDLKEWDKTLMNEETFKHLYSSNKNLDTKNDNNEVEYFTYHLKKKQFEIEK